MNSIETQEIKEEGEECGSLKGCRGKERTYWEGLIKTGTLLAGTPRNTTP